MYFENGIDLERLHAHFISPIRERQSGKTVAMLHVLLGAIEVQDTPDIVGIVSHKANLETHIIPMFRELLELYEIPYEITKSPSYKIKVLDKTVTFEAVDSTASVLIEEALRGRTNYTIVMLQRWATPFDYVGDWADKIDDEVESKYERYITFFQFDFGIGSILHTISLSVKTDYRKLHEDYQRILKLIQY